LARAHWAELAPQLRRARQVGPTDRTALVALCLEWARYLEAVEKVTTLGMVRILPNGYPMVNPYLSIANRALAAVNKLLPELGLTPSSRSRVSTIGTPAPDDPFAEFDTPFAPTAH
jgi:P27 family predicted phage terminase small subunit